MEHSQAPRSPGEGLFRRQDSLYANCYATKPVDVEWFVQVVKSVEVGQFDVVAASLPRQMAA